MATLVQSSQRNAMCLAMLIATFSAGALANEIEDPGERYSLPTLHYIKRDHSEWGKPLARLRPNCGPSFLAWKGERVGRDQGVITKISDRAVTITELVSDGQGGWLERPRVLRKEAAHPVAPARLHYVAYAKGAFDGSAWIRPEGCPVIRVEREDTLEETPDGDDVTVLSVSPTEVRLRWFERGNANSVTWRSAILPIERSR